MYKLGRIGIFLLVVSVYLLAFAVPVSIALDNIAICIGFVGILIFLSNKDLTNFPPVKPILFFIIPPVLTMLSQLSLGFLMMSSLKQHIIPYFSSYKILKERAIVKKVIVVLGISTIILTISIAFGAFTHQNIKHVNWNYLQFHLNNLKIAKGFLGHHLTAAGVLLLLTFLFLGFYIYKREAFYLVVLFFSIFGLILTQSRAAWLAFIVGVGIMMIFLSKSKKQIMVTWVFFLVVIGLLLSIPNLRSRFFSSFNPDANWSNKDRLVLWQSYIYTFENYSLKQKLFGAGKKTRLYIKYYFPKAFEKVTGKKETFEQIKNHFHGGASHNIYLRFLGETGIIGLIGYVLFWLYVLRLNFLAIKSNPMKEILISLSCGYVAFIVMGLFENNFMDATVKIALMFILGLNFYILDAREKLF